MSEVLDILTELKTNGIVLSLDESGTNLKLKGSLSSLTDSNKEKIKNKKEEIIRFFKNHKNYSTSNVIQSVQPQASYPLSNAQHRLWILSQFTGGSESYNMPYSIVLKDDIAIDHFKRAVLSVINRHESLRTVFRTDETGKPHQFIVGINNLNFSIDYKDFTKQEEKTALVQSYISEDAYRPFDLEKGPLLRAALLRTDEKRYVFYYNMHHIISDGWSMGVLSKDVLSFYESYAKGEDSGLPPLSIHYKDYASWQLSQLESPAYEAHKAYWKERLSGDLPLLDLPRSKIRPKSLTHNGLSLSTYIDAQTTQKLKRFSREHGGTLFMGLLTGWNVLVYRYTGNKDTITGSPVAGRDHSDLANQIGFYVNTLALRTMLDPAMTFEQLYQSVKADTLSAYEHQVYPFDRLADDLDLARNTSRNAIFDVMLVLQNTEENDLNLVLSEEEINGITSDGNTKSKFDIMITFVEQGEYLLTNLIYNTDVYEEKLMTQLMTHYKQMLASISDNPKESIDRINYLTNEERHQLLVTFNDTKIDYPVDQTIIDMVAAQVHKTPDRIAVVFEGISLTYKELDQLSDGLAHVLCQKYDVKAGDKVGIMIERSHWMIISILGVLKAGAAYVPIDKYYPEDRISFMMEDSCCALIIDDQWIDKIKEELPDGSINIRRKIAGTDLVYIIYTSGSTGKPKGIMMPHKAVMNLISAHEKMPVLCHKVTQFTSISFDVSFQEIFFTLTNGGELHVLNEENRKNPEKLIHYVQKENIETMFLPTSFFQFLSSENYLNGLSHVKDIVVAGEQLILSDSCRKFLKKQKVNLHNHYGPAETHVVTTYVVNENEEIPSIGRPVSNARIYILNEAMELQPIGVFGLMYIGGVCVSKGYLNQEELTKERFISNKLDHNSIMYATGDIGRWLPDGTIEFLGRKDDQIKIRGFRVELGEIRNAMLGHDAILEAVITVRQNVKKENELTAYYTASHVLSNQEIRLFMKNRLPEYMVPAYFLQLDQIPLTKNGKIDKKNLPDPKESELSTGKEYTGPTNDIEEKLVLIWKEVLQRDNIGIHDDFFELGGHSLKAIRVLSEIHRVFDEKLDINKLFLSPSIKQISLEITNSKWMKENRTKSHSGGYKKIKI